MALSMNMVTDTRTKNSMYNLNVEDKIKTAVGPQVKIVVNYITKAKCDTDIVKV